MIDFFIFLIGNLEFLEYLICKFYINISKPSTSIDFHYKLSNNCRIITYIVELNKGIRFQCYLYL